MMLSMRLADPPLQNGPAPVASLPRPARWLRCLAALLASVIAILPGAVRADTGASLPPGYTSDIPAPGVAPAGAPSIPVRQVSDTDEVDEDDEYTDTDPSALTDFREPLTPYGAWVTDATYGTVWVPNATVVGADFAPYQTAGHWALTDDDQWLWVSDYDWGYIPFHYGRWIWINGNGWSWIPGRTYAPAWVSWRVGDEGYIGWAPMPPVWYWSGGVATNLWVTPYAAYCFVPTTYVFHERVHHYVVRDVTAVRTIAARTRSYQPARPTVVSAHASGGVGSRSGSGRHFKVASPSLAEARVSSSFAPKARVTPDTRSRAFATRKSTAAARRAISSGRGFQSDFSSGARHSTGFPSRSRDFTTGSSQPTPITRESRSIEPVRRIRRDTRTIDPTPTPRPTHFSRPSVVGRPTPGVSSAPQTHHQKFAPATPTRVGGSPSSSGFRPSAQVKVAPSSTPSRSSSSSSHSSGHRGGGRHR
jgi:hypothetical protein